MSLHADPDPDPRGKNWRETKLISYKIYIKKILDFGLYLVIFQSIDLEKINIIEIKNFKFLNLSFQCFFGLIFGEGLPSHNADPCGPGPGST